MQQQPSGAHIVQLPFTAEGVVEALKALHQDPKNYNLADKWLVKFQQEENAFVVALRLLEHPVSRERKKK